jgi:hypothetical protein
MSQLRHSMAVLLPVVVGLTGSTHETRALSYANPARVASTKAAMRNL